MDEHSLDDHGDVMPELLDQEDISDKGEVSSFRRRFTEAQLTDSMSDGLLPENVDAISERVHGENSSLLAEMDDAIHSLHVWRSRAAQEETELLQEEEEEEEEEGKEEERPETHSYAYDVDFQREHASIGEDQEEQNRVESLKKLLETQRLCDKGEATDYLVKNLKVDMMRIDFEASEDSLGIIAAREREIMKKNLELELQFSGLSSALQAATQDIDAVLKLV